MPAASRNLPEFVAAPRTWFTTACFFIVKKLVLQLRLWRKKVVNLSVITVANWLLRNKRCFWDTRRVDHLNIRLCTAKKSGSSTLFNWNNEQIVAKVVENKIIFLFWQWRHNRRSALYFINDAVIKEYNHSVFSLYQWQKCSAETSKYSFYSLHGP